MRMKGGAEWGWTIEDERAWNACLKVMEDCGRRCNVLRRGSRCV